MGHPRNPDADRNIREATSALLAEAGYAGLTVEGVAARSGVAKTTIYRRWPSKAELVFGATVHPDELGPAPDTGGLRGDLAEVMRRVVEDLSARTASEALLGVLVDTARDPELKDAVRERFLGAERAWMAEIVGRAVGRGEIPPGTDPDLVLDLVLGPVFWRVLVTGGPVDPQLGGRVVDAILEGLAAFRAPSAGERGRRPTMRDQEGHDEEV